VHAPAVGMLKSAAPYTIKLPYSHKPKVAELGQTDHREYNSMTLQLYIPSIFLLCNRCVLQIKEKKVRILLDLIKETYATS
jgi:hypothetical protein